MQRLKEAKTVKRVVSITTLIVGGSVALYYYRTILTFLAILLLVAGCCVAVPVVGIPMSIIEERENQAKMDDFRTALNADLPENITFFIEDYSRKTISLPVKGARNDEFQLAQNPNGRYMLTSRGLYNFITDTHTRLECSQNSSIKNGFWFNDEMFFWKGCIFHMSESEQLQSGTIESGPCEGKCSKTEKQGWLETTLPNTDEIYNRVDAYYFVRYTSDETPQILWARLLKNDELLKTVEQSGLPIVPIEEQKEATGRRIKGGTESSSPDGQFKARLDENKNSYIGGRVLTVERTSDNAIIAQVSVQDIHQIWIDDSQLMTVEGWTGDSKKIVFSIMTKFPLPHNQTSLGGYELREHFILKLAGCRKE